MDTALAEVIARTPLCDTHEHLRTEAEYVNGGPDIVQSLFDNYVMTDLTVAGWRRGWTARPRRPPSSA